jgi:hypothetical protein
MTETTPPARPPMGKHARMHLGVARRRSQKTALDEPHDALLDDAQAMRLAEWTYYNIEEVWSAFNLLAEAVSSGFRVEAPTEALQREVDAWSASVQMHECIRMWVKNALVYGRCVMEVGPTFLKVRNPRFLDLEQDERGALVAVWQRIGGGERRPVPREHVRVFTLHRLFSDDLRGVSAVHPILQTVDDMLEARKVNRVLSKRFRTPVRVIELPSYATPADQRALTAQLKKTPPDTDLVLPPGAKLQVLNAGKDALQPDELLRAHLTDRIFMGLGVPKIALGIPDGTQRSVSEVQRAMLLEDKVAPYQRQVKEFAERLYAERFGRKCRVTFGSRERVAPRGDGAESDASDGA